MKIQLTIFYPLAFCLFISTANSQTASITEVPASFTTYPYSSPDPVPRPGRIYPYFRYDGYTTHPVTREWKMVKMENDFIEVYITPEIGGKIWGALEKSTGKYFIYFNHSVKFRDIAMRGPWTSGGIEINFGVIGHAPTCSTPVDYFLRKFDDGSVSCFLGAIDLASRTEWRVEINLRPDRSYFTTHALWFNPTAQEQAYYHWMNGSVKADGNLEFSYPGNAYIGHNGIPSSWPVDPEGREISFYEKNNFGSYKSYHVLGVYTHFFGGYWHDDDFGFGHYSNYDDKPGKKIWIWGLSRQGMIWEDLLTDRDGQYIEVQSGRLFNQESASSTYTPFKHRGFLPYSADFWTEHWFPVIQTNGVDRAIPEASVNTEFINDSLHIWICSNTFLGDTITLLSEADTIVQQFETLVPTETAHYSYPFKGDPKQVSLKIGQHYVVGPGGLAGQTLSRPLTIPEFDWTSLQGLYLLGKEKFRQRDYSGAETFFRECLKIDQNYLPSLTGLAQVKLKHLAFQEAWELTRQSLSIDTYDPGANFYYGIASLKTGRITDAKDGFSIATASVAYRCAAYTELAKIYFREGDMQKALEYTEKSMINNHLNLQGLELMAIIHRKMGMNDQASAVLVDLLNIDPLDHLGRFEIFLPEGVETAQDELSRLIRNELPQETFLETALKYVTLDCYREAIWVLEKAPEHPMVLYWLAYLNSLMDNPDKANQFLEKANQLSPYLVFPFREESVKMLSWAMNASNSWKPKYYLSLIYWHSGQTGIARSFVEACGSDPDHPVFYLAKGDLFFNEDPAAAQKSYLKAVELDPDGWRPGYRITRFYMTTGKIEEALTLSKKYFNTHPENYYLGLQYADLLNRTGQYDSCIDLLNALTVLPNEGATSGRLIWREANLKKAVQSMMNKDYRVAQNHIAFARVWPENLGVGKPYDVDERLEDFLLAALYQITGQDEELSAIQQKIIGAPLSGTLSAEDFITAWTLKRKNRKTEADRIMNQFENLPGNQALQWCMAIYNREFKAAEEILVQTKYESGTGSDLTLDLLIRLHKNSDIFE